MSEVVKVQSVNSRRPFQCPKTSLEVANAVEDKITVLFLCGEFLKLTLNSRSHWDSAFPIGLCVDRSQSDHALIEIQIRYCKCQKLILPQSCIRRHYQNRSQMGIASHAFTSAGFDKRKFFAKGRESFAARFCASLNQLRSSAAGEFKWIRLQPAVGDRVIQHSAKKL